MTLIQQIKKESCEISVIRGISGKVLVFSVPLCLRGRFWAYI